MQWDDRVSFKNFGTNLRIYSSFALFMAYTVCMLLQLSNSFLTQVLPSLFWYIILHKNASATNFLHILCISMTKICFGF